MAHSTFYKLDGDEIEIDADEVAHLKAGEEEATTVIELEDGSEVTVSASQVEVAAELGLNPLDYVDPEDDDESHEGLDEDDGVHEL